MQAGLSLAMLADSAHWHGRPLPSVVTVCDGPTETVIPNSMSVSLMVPVEGGAQKHSPGNWGIRVKLGNGMGPGALGGRWQ